MWENNNFASNRPFKFGTIYGLKQMMTRVDDIKDLDPVMTIYNLIESSNNYSKTSGSLYQLCKDEPGNFIAYS